MVRDIDGVSLIGIEDFIPHPLYSTQLCIDLNPRSFLGRVLTKHIAVRNLQILNGIATRFGSWLDQSTGLPLLSQLQLEICESQRQHLS